MFTLWSFRIERVWESVAEGADFGFDPSKTSHSARQKAPIPISYWLLFSADFFGLSTKFGHPITRPLDLGGHTKLSYVNCIISVGVFQIYNPTNMKDHMSLPMDLQLQSRF